MFARVLALQPASAAALAGLGRARLAQGDAVRAVDYLERALAIEPSATSLHYPLAIAYRNRGASDQAEAHLRQRGHGQPTLIDPLMGEYRRVLATGEAYHNRGVLALDAGEFAMAAALFRQGLELEPAHAALRHALGTALYRMGQTAAAIDEFETVLRQSPDRAETHFSLGVILAEQKRYAEALARFTAAVTYRPDFMDAHLGLAEVLQSTGRLAESAAHWARVVDLRPGFAEAWIAGAQVLIQLERYRQARDWLIAARSAHPNRAEIVRLRETVDAILTARSDARRRP
jgi:tetratricopeptide (TPR) repeat protein